ncbi:MAG: GNAT family N-acetyltransferase [Clostridia bacterium]|nr:GNAT family N-acetyltransferase [Clostridia bacterium]MBR0302452.1 GNAT family N-acetyltransferase [Clostridia bacterium]
MQYEIITCAEGDDEFIADKLNDVTDSKIDFEDTIEDELVVFKVTDGDGKIIAGCNLIVNCWRVADLDILWVEEKYRRQGIGSALIREAERAARAKGCRFMTLGTFDFQARPMYEKFGFTVCGTIEDCPTKGHKHYDMIKRLDTPCEKDASPAPCDYEIVHGDEEDAEFIDDSLVEYNLSVVPSARDFDYFGKKIPGNDGGTIAGGFAGINFWNIAFLDMLWVDEPCRGKGIGSALLSDLERAAKEKGAFIVMADARDRNADFFKKSGYTVYCTFDDYPSGYGKYKMMKRL